jgi:hypothetical protein
VEGFLFAKKPCRLRSDLVLRSNNAAIITITEATAAIAAIPTGGMPDLPVSDSVFEAAEGIGCFDVVLTGLTEGVANTNVV